MRLALFLVLLAVALSAVEEGPFQVTKVIDGDTIEVMYSPQPLLSSVKPEPTRVRLLYVDTPESSDNDQGKAMEEGTHAANYLRSLLPQNTMVALAGPGEQLERDRNQQLLAIVMRSNGGEKVTRGPVVDGGDGRIGTSMTIENPNGPALQVLLISQGHSVYWRKYGDAEPWLHDLLVKAQEVAQFMKLGAWATAPKWMGDKASERTAPKP